MFNKQMFICLFVCLKYMYWKPYAFSVIILIVKTVGLFNILLHQGTFFSLKISGWNELGHKWCTCILQFLISKYLVIFFLVGLVKSWQTDQELNEVCSIIYTSMMHADMIIYKIHLCMLKRIFFWNTCNCHKQVNI